MSRITTKIINTNWTCPAGVTQIVVQPCNSNGTAMAGQCIPLTVVPNTTYAVTINGSSYLYGSPNTFGAIYRWTGSGYLEIAFIE